MAFSGQDVTIPLGQQGLLTDLAPTDIPPGALIYSNNITLSNGTVQKAPGTLRYNSTPLSAGVVAVHDWWPDIITQRMIAVTSDGKIFRDLGDRSFGTGPINSGFGKFTPNCIFIEGGLEVANNPKKLFLFSAGLALPQVLNADGVTFTTIAAPSPDWTATNRPKAGVIHYNRLWAFAGQAAYASDSGDHENFQANFLLQNVFPGEGGEIRGSHVYKGRLFCFKDGGFVYYLVDDDTDSSNWYWKKLASNFGLAAPNAITEVLNDMLAGNTAGTVNSYTGTLNLGGADSEDIFKELGVESYVRANTSRVGTTEQHALYYPEKKLCFFTYRSSYRTYNDTLVVIDFARQSPRVSFWGKGSPQCLALRKDVNEIQRPIYGDKDGYIHLMDYEDRKEGPVAYTGAFQTPHLDFRFVDPSLAERNKQFIQLAVTYVPEGNWDLSCDYFIDGKFVETITFPMNQYLTDQLDTFLLNTSRLSQLNSETFIRPLLGTGRTISFKFYNAGLNQSFQISSITVGLKPSGSMAQKSTT